MIDRFNPLWLQAGLCSGASDVRSRRRPRSVVMMTTSSFVVAPASRIREMYENAEARVRGLLERGRREGVFRIDLPVEWMLAVTHATLNTAA